MSISHWMSWVDGVDLVAVTDTSLSQPNIIVHVAGMVTTPEGSSPSGMILLNPNPESGPELFGFLSGKREVGAYFGPKIFAGTPFESAPVQLADITIEKGNGWVAALIKVEGIEILSKIENLGMPELVNRPPGQMTPFDQQGIEAAGSKATLTVAGREIGLSLPQVGLTGGAAAVWAPAGIYSR